MLRVFADAMVKKVPLVRYRSGRVLRDGAALAMLEQDILSTTP